MHRRSSTAERLLEVGTIARAHGLSGEVLVALLSDRGDRLANGSVLYAGERPLTVVAARAHQRRWIVRFAGVDDRAAAEELHGATLRAEARAAGRDDGTLWVHQVIGREVVTRDGAACGRVTAVQANPAHDLLVLESGTLIPSVFLVEGPPAEQLVIDPPEGLLDL